MTDWPTTKLRWLGSVRGPLFLPELRHIPPPNTPLMITSQHPPRIVIQTLKRSWNGRGHDWENRRRGRRPCLYLASVHLSHLDLRALRNAARRALGGPPEAEPGADAGPAAPQAPP